jgi:hypothetical protein
MPVFVLQFDIEHVPDYAARYPAEEDHEVLAIGRTARDRGHYLLDEFLRACRWKTARSGPLVHQNSADSVETSTRIALRESSEERERTDALLLLRGVGWPTASVLLHLAYPERYPILDQRALQALGVRPPSTHGFKFWSSYVGAWLRLVEQAGVDGRSFDRALWQWSKEQGVSL